jgi:Ca2+-binding RTX toxin-like protein
MRLAVPLVVLLLVLLAATPSQAQQPRLTGVADLETSASFGLRALEDADQVTALGDVDGDGRRDAAIVDTMAEVARVVLAGDGPPGLRAFRIRGVDDEDLQDSLADAGDVNGDGLADIAAATDDEVVIVLGSRAPRDVDLGRPEQRDVTLIGPGDTPRARAAGDVNGDGIGDLLVSASGEGDASRRPRAWIVFGGRDLSGRRALARLGGAGITLIGAVGDFAFGFGGAGAGDVDGDGLGDVVIGSPVQAGPTRGEPDDPADAERAYRGRAWIVYGRREGGDLRIGGPGVTRLEGRRTYLLGLTAAGPGDVNGDGLGDVAVAAPSLPLIPLPQGSRGSVFVVFGDRARPASIDLEALGPRGFVVQGRRINDGMGTDLAAAGDLDGDGRPDLLVSELGAQVPYLDEVTEVDAPGAVHVVYGSDSPTTVDLAAPGDRALLLRGAGGDRAVSADSGSDLDADGRREILVARPGACRIGRLGEGDAVAIELGAPGPLPAGRGGASADSLTGGPVGDTLLGFDGADLLQGRDGHDCVAGGDGPDRIRGGLSGDALFGDEGDDDVRGDSGCDRIFGGPGADTIIAGPVRVPLVAAMRDPIGARDRDQVLGGAGDDRIVGGLDRDSLVGEDGDDRIDGGADHDEIDGEAGRDRIAGGPGDDRIDGGRGADVVRGGAGRDLLDGDGDGDGGDGFGFAELPPPGPDLLEGGAGDDMLFGGDGRDVLVGGSGRDRIHSRDGRRDVVRCGPGRDTVIADRADRVSACEVVRRRRR